MILALFTITPKLGWSFYLVENYTHSELPRPIGRGVPNELYPFLLWPKCFLWGFKMIHFQFSALTVQKLVLATALVPRIAIALVPRIAIALVPRTATALVPRMATTLVPRIANALVPRIATSLVPCNCRRSFLHGFNVSTSHQTFK